MRERAMKERGILFSVPLVGPILDGTKTQTRRLVKPQPRGDHYLQPMWGVSPPPGPVAFGTPGLWREVGPDYPDGDEDDRRCPHGSPGDRLWVREPWRTYASLDRLSPAEIAPGAGVQYEAGGSNVPGHEILLGMGRYRHGRFMPRWASRILLEVAWVRAEPLQRITEADARAEGTVSRDGFVARWRDLHGAPFWESDPWVWVISFRRVKP